MATAVAARKSIKGESKEEKSFCCTDWCTKRSSGRRRRPDTGCWLSCLDAGSFLVVPIDWNQAQAVQPGKPADQQYLGSRGRKQNYWSARDEEEDDIAASHVKMLANGSGNSCWLPCAVPPVSPTNKAHTIGVEASLLYVFFFSLLLSSTFHEERETSNEGYLPDTELQTVLLLSGTCL